MMNDNLKGIFGLCRRAGKMSLGHDAVVTAIKKRNAQLVITCNDASERLKREIKDECSFDGRNIEYVDAPFGTDELAFCISSKAKVISIDDQGFAKKLITILNQDN
jgi:ribosomal protein L7Ae-like RNA K-turn-binding protein